MAAFTQATMLAYVTERIRARMGRLRSLDLASVDCGPGTLTPTGATT